MNPDLVTREFTIKKKKIKLMYLESVTSNDTVSDFVINAIVNIKKNGFKNIEENIYNGKVSKSKDLAMIDYYLSNGFTLLFIDDYYLYLETKESLDRGVTNTLTEVTLRGSKDSFTENYNKNIGLIRKRIKDSNIGFKELVIGKRTKTKVCISFINDITNLSNVSKIYHKLKKINIDGILDISHIRDFLNNDKRTLFPTMIISERPDLACKSLLNGKICIIVENSPFVLIIPGLFNDFLISTEDEYQKSVNGSITRYLRLMAFFTTILVPSLYVAITTFNQEIIPDTLLISLAVQRSTVPFPTAFAVFIFMITFEILREADMRMPSNMGTSISIVGALVLGDAAVNAGIVSPIVVIIVAISAITGLLFTDIDFINALRFWKFLFLFFSTVMGLIGFVVALLIFLTKLCSIEVLGIPYTDYLNMSIKPKNKDKYRYLSNNKLRLDDSNED